MIVSYLTSGSFNSYILNKVCKLFFCSEGFLQVVVSKVLKENNGFDENGFGFDIR